MILLKSWTQKILHAIGSQLWQVIQQNTVFDIVLQLQKSLSIASLMLYIHQAGVEPWDSVSNLLKVQGIAFLPPFHSSSLPSILPGLFFYSRIIHADTCIHIATVTIFFYIRKKSGKRNELKNFGSQNNEFSLQMPQ